jgi:hypothetical protein
MFRKLSEITSEHNINKKQNSEALVRRRTIPAERPPLADEVSANFIG